MNGQTVTQADREAAASVAEHWHHNGREYPHVHFQHVANGLNDDWLLVQAFARHRTAHSGEGRSNGAGEDGEHALKWINHNLLLAKGLMKSSAEAGNGHENFRAHDAYRALTVAKNALSPPQGEVERLPADVVRLVIAAREIAFNDWDGDSEEWTVARKELDDASEAFASRVPWDDEPDAEEDDRSWLGTSIDRIDAMEEAAQLRHALTDAISMLDHIVEQTGYASGSGSGDYAAQEELSDHREKWRAALAQPEAGGE